jgi:hypothetical protein
LFLRLSVAAVLALTAGMAGQKKGKAGMDDARFITLRDSRDPRQLMNTALELAQSPQPADHRSLAGWLGSVEFLNRLDSAQEYQIRRRDQLRVSRLLKALSANASQSAKEALVVLTESGGYLAEGVRIDLLILACAEIRPAPQKVLAFWDRYSRPGDGYYNLTIRAMLDNGSEPAMVLLERKMADPGHDFDAKVRWLRGPVLRHRNDVELLRACERMLASSMPPHLKPSLVEALFDYDQEWYAEDPQDPPPNRAAASPQARELLFRIATYALQTVHLPPRVRLATETAYRELAGTRQQ